MPKLTKAWVKTHTQTNGEKFYTAHIVEMSKLLWIIPIYWNMVVVQTWTPTMPSYPKGVFDLYYTSDGLDAYRFSTKQEAEDELMEQINKILDKINDKNNKKVIGTQKDFVNLFPINDFA